MPLFFHFSAIKLLSEMENTYFNIFDVLSLFGAFLSLLLGSILAFNEKFRTKSNIAHAISLFSTFLLISRNILTNLDFVTLESFIVYTPLFYAYFIPLGFYFNIIYLLNPNYQFRRRDYWLLGPVFLQVIIDLIIICSYFFFPALLKANLNMVIWYGDYFFNSIITFYFLFILYASWEKITTYQSSLLNNYSSIEGKDLEWIKSTIKIYCFILLLWIMSWLGGIYYGTYSQLQFYLLWLIATGFICLVAFQFIINQNFYLVPHFQEKTEEKPKALSENTEEHYQYLLQLMQKERLYQDAELNMDILAEKMQLSKGYLSRIINHKENKNFYDFVNTFRVEEVKKNLSHPDYAHYSILGIGLEAGFKSKSTFNTVFKKMTGMPPSSYKKRSK